MSEGYNSSAARTVTKLSQRRLDYWDELGIVSPSIRKAEGKGTVRLYSFEDLVKLRIVKNLRDMGLSLQRIHKALRKLPRRPARADPLLDEVLLTDGKTVFRRLESGQLVDVLAGGQLVFSIVQVGRIRQETEESVIRLEEKRKRWAMKKTQRRQTRRRSTRTGS